MRPDHPTGSKPGAVDSAERRRSQATRATRAKCSPTDLRRDVNNEAAQEEWKEMQDGSHPVHSDSLGATVKAPSHRRATSRDGSVHWCGIRSIAAMVPHRSHELESPTMDLHGYNLLGANRSNSGSTTFRATDPRTGEDLAPEFHEATAAEVAEAAQLATTAAETFGATDGPTRAKFLRRIADEIEGLGSALLERARAETGLPEPRLVMERGRTTGQLRMFADLVEAGGWVDARIDTAQPNRAPIPKPDLRRMLVPLGPVAVFGASNFPLAFSVAGGDSASALAAGCPVVCKAHPAHPGTSELVGHAILAAVAACELPNGVFSLVHGRGHEPGAELVQHPGIEAVGFTGSLRGGRAIFDLAARRPNPIPVFAEMGSVNPVFVLPGAMAERGEAIADGLANAVTLGAGQFCTNPGLHVVLDDVPGNALIQAVGTQLAAASSGTMVHSSIKTAYDQALERVSGLPGVESIGRSNSAGAHPSTDASPALLAVSADNWLTQPALAEEVFGPAAIAVRASAKDQLVAIARSLEGHLTATLHATPGDLSEHQELVRVLGQKVGRLILNGYPTGVEVCPSMHHGGPYPATTDARTTSVGTAAILRFARPLCFQGFPDRALPAELQDANPRGIWRTVDGEFTTVALDGAAG